MSISRVAVVGAGLLGLAAAREVTQRFPDAEVTVFDKAQTVAAQQSGHTSGIVDAGLEQTPGSTAARLARRGTQLLVPYMAERGVAYRECSQLLIAQNTDEAERLEEIFARAKDNEVPGARLLERSEIRAVEPGARGVLGLFAPHAAIADFAALAEALAADVREAGGKIRLRTEVTGFDSMSNEVRLRGQSTPETDPGERTATSGDGAGEDRDETPSSGDDNLSDREATPSGRDASPSGRDATHSDRDDDLDDQVGERPRTYRGSETGEPVIGIGDELRDRFGEQEWFKKAESTLGEWTEKLSSSWSRSSDTSEGPNSRGNRDTRDAGDHREAATSRPTGADTEEVLGTFDTVIICAGLHADRIAATVGLDTAPRIVPFTSHYYLIPDTSTEAVRGIIGSVPDPQAPLTETTIVRGLNNQLVLGPNTFVSLSRDGDDKHGFDLGDIGSTAKFKGFWKFAAQTAKTAARSMKPLISRSAFVDGVARFVPELRTEAVAEGPHGVRAQAMTDEGELIDDLLVTKRGRLTTVRSVPKWGAASALAIGEAIVDRAFDGEDHRRRE